MKTNHLAFLAAMLSVSLAANAQSPVTVPTAQTLDFRILQTEKVSYPESRTGDLSTSCSMTGTSHTLYNTHEAGDYTSGKSDSTHDLSMTCKNHDQSGECVHSLSVMLATASDNNAYVIACELGADWHGAPGDYRASLRCEQKPVAPSWNCRALPAGATFQGRWKKDLLSVGFTTEKGKQRETLYTVLKSKVLTREESGSEGHSALPTTQPRAVCNVTSAPTSSEIQIDGEFVGNTPAKVVLPVGKHMIKLSSFGYKEWVREISVTDGSELTVGPTLEKQ